MSTPCVLKKQHVLPACKASKALLPGFSELRAFPENSLPVVASGGPVLGRMDGGVLHQIRRWNKKVAICV